MVSALRQGLERRCQQSAESGGSEDRLSVERNPDTAWPDRHHRELRADRRKEGSQDGEGEAGATIPAVSPTRCGAQASGRCQGVRRRTACPDPALGGFRQIELHRLVIAPIDRADGQRRDGVRFGDCRYRPAHPRSADPGHYQAVCSGRRYGGPCGPVRRSAALHRGRQEDHHHDGPEISLHPRRYWRAASRPPLRDLDRRGAFQSGGQGLGGAQCCTHRRRRRRRR
jgi:hypothetical protein